jgi:hypothetical protein
MRRSLLVLLLSACAPATTAPRERPVCVGQWAPITNAAGETVARVRIVYCPPGARDTVEYVP